MRSSLVLLASEQGGQVPQLLPIGYGIVSIVVLLALLVITFAFRSFGSRYRDR
ncbi:MAG: hypothetical protein ACK5H2_08555 [Beutenbergiaceae bacterium]